MTNRTAMRVDLDKGGIKISFLERWLQRAKSRGFLEVELIKDRVGIASQPNASYLVPKQTKREFYATQKERKRYSRNNPEG